MPSRLREPLVALTLALGFAVTGCAHSAKLTAAPAATPPAPVAHNGAPAAPAPAPPVPSASSAPSPAAASEYEDAFFDFDQSALRADARTALDEDAKELRTSPKTVVRIEGNCDERGTIEYNLALGERRAQAAKTYLMNEGVPASRIQTISYGKEHPFASGHDEAAWAKNRRDHMDVHQGPA
jgi:peptidoglycan-associated lipoprotein